MKKQVVVAGAVVLATIVLFKSGVVDALIAFLLVGAIPGTTYSLPPATMSLIISILLLAILLRSAAIPFVNYLRINRLARRYLQRKERLPKRRFGQI